MNKKLLFATLSLAALTACTTSDDFESKQIAEEASPVQIEVLNFNDAAGTRASMDGNSIKWSAKTNDLFTLYHGGAAGNLDGFQNATFSAKDGGEGKPAALMTPTMILPGEAIMVWPVDSDFTIKSTDALSIKIPAVQDNIENNIPYVSDRFTIGAYGKFDNDPNSLTYNEYNTAGKDRKYTVYMRPMASQLNLKADYAGTAALIEKLYDGGSECPEDGGIDPIKVTSIDLLTGAGTEFTTKIALAWAGAANANWPASITNKTWSDQTNFGAVSTQVTKLTAKDKCLNGNDGCKILILPQAVIAGGVVDAAVVVNTNYGLVYVAANGVGDSKYSATEDDDAWYRYISEGTATIVEETKILPIISSGEFKDKYKTTATIADGMMQTINTFSTYTATSGTVKGEPMGIASTRYVKVLLNYLDMTNLHIKSDKQLRDVALVWKKMGLDPVTVFLDGGQEGDAVNEFTISQNTIKVINKVNEGKAFANWFKVMPCKDAGEECTTILVKDGGDIQDVAFIADNGGTKASVVFNEGETWNWKGDVKAEVSGVKQFINKGIMNNAAAATGTTIKTVDNTGVKNAIPFWNYGTWNITSGKLFVEISSVTNMGTVKISSGAEYRQDGSTFNNGAGALPTRFGGDDKQIGFVENKGVFAVVNGGKINNVGLIEHADKDAKTFITTNQSGAGNFGAAFAAPGNKMGRINLPWGNKDEDNVSISSALDQGFVSVTVNGEVTGALNAEAVGPKVNYVIVNSGITEISGMDANVKYLEINQPGTELAWNVAAPTTYDGLIVLSPVNIKLGTTIHVLKACYLGADMYVGGTFDNNTLGVLPEWDGYYGATSGNYATMYVTYN